MSLEKKLRIHFTSKFHESYSLVLNVIRFFATSCLFSYYFEVINRLPNIGYLGYFRLARHVLMNSRFSHKGGSDNSLCINVLKLLVIIPRE